MTITFVDYDKRRITGTRVSHLTMYRDDCTSISQFGPYPLTSNLHVLKHVHISGYRDSEFQAKIDAGIPCNNPYLKKVISADFIPITWHYEEYPKFPSCNPKWAEQYGDFYLHPDEIIGKGYCVPPDSFWVYLEACKSQAVMQAFSKSRAEANLGATYGEAKETLGLIKSSLKQLIKVATYIKKRKFGKLWRMMKKTDVADVRMAYRYGVTPLVQDVKNYTKALSRILWPEKPKVFTARSSWNMRKKHSVQDILVEIPIWNGYYCFRGDYHVELEGVARAGVLYDVIREDTEVVLGTLELAQAGWELMTLSFVVDWFANVGTAISALAPKTGLEQRLSWKSARYFINEEFRIKTLDFQSYSPTMDYEMALMGAPVLRKQTLTKTRVPLNGVFDDLRISFLPDIKLTFNQIGDLATIIKGFVNIFLH